MAKVCPVCDSFGFGCRGTEHTYEGDCLARKPTRKTVKVTFSDGNTITTEINGTEEQIRCYYLGKSFNFGDNDSTDNMQKAVKVEFLNQNAL